MCAFEGEDWRSVMCVLEGNNTCIGIAGVWLIVIIEIQRVINLDAAVIFWQFDDDFVYNVWSYNVLIKQQRDFHVSKNKLMHNLKLII
jgi:hypothetical protein